MKVVAICALQNLVMYSRSNRRAVAEAGGVQVVLDLIGSSDPETSIQAAMFVKLLFSNNTIQEYASSETVRAITGEFFFAILAVFTAWLIEHLNTFFPLQNSYKKLHNNMPSFYFLEKAALILV